MTRRDAHENYRRLSDAAKTPKEKNKVARKLAQTDLFFLLVYVLGREDCDRDWIFDRVKEVEANPDGHLDLWAREHYKDCWIKTPVLTSKGWKEHGSLVKGDKVFSPGGKLVTVIATKHFNDSSCYSVKIHAADPIIAGGGHLWNIEAPARNRVKGTNKRITRKKKIVTTVEMKAAVEKEKYRVGILTTIAYDRPDVPLPVDPYVLGVWLGDGFSASPAVCGIDAQIFREIEKRGVKLLAPHKRRNGDHADFQVRTMFGQTQHFKSLNLINNKHIPDIYMSASARQRRELLWGLIDTDGNVASTRNATVTFAQAKKELAEQVCSLACSLGYKARLTPSRTTKSWHVTFQVSAGDNYPPCLLQRKRDLLKQGHKKHLASQTWYVDSVTPVATVPTNCIQVDSEDGMYLIGKSFIPTHNSTIITFAKTIQDILIDPEVTVGIFSHTRPIAKGFLRQIKRELESNKKLYILFPDILWENSQRSAPKWSEDDGIIVQRKSNPAASTVEAWGLVDGQPVSKHFSLLVYDDVVTRESCTTPEMIAKVNQSWELSLNLGVEGGRKRYIGTRYHYCLIGESRILMADFSHKPIKDVQVGEEIVGWSLEGGTRYLKPVKVINKGIHEKQPVKTYHLDCGRSVTCTETHKWWRGPHGSGAEYKTVGMGYHQMKSLRRLLDPVEIDQGREAGWLAGMFDGEGTIRKNTNYPSATISIAQSMHNPGVVAELKKVLESCGYEYSECWIPEKGNSQARCNFIINGGWRERYRFLAEVSPARADKLRQSLYAQLLTSKATITSITDAGEQDVYWIETESGNYVAEGFCSKNSDTYKLMMDRGAATPRIHPATKDGKVNGKPVLMQPDALTQKRREMGPYIFATQMLLDPKADEVQGFKNEWLKFWPCNYFHNFNKIILCDPASEKKKGSDYTVFVVLGLGEDKNYYIIDLIRDRLSLTERANTLFALHREFRPQFVGYEKYGKDSDIEHYNQRMDRDNYRFGITPLGGRVKKNDRIRSLIPLFEQGRIFIPDRIIKTNYENVTEDLTKTFINEEYLAFPVAAHDDMLDCLARITDPDCYRDFPIKGAFSAKARQEVDYDPFSYSHKQVTDYDVFAR